MFRGRSQTQQTVGRKRDSKRNAPVHTCAQVHQSTPLQEARFFFYQTLRRNSIVRKGQQESNRLKNVKGRLERREMSKVQEYRGNNEPSYSVQTAEESGSKCSSTDGCNGATDCPPSHPLQARRDAQAHATAAASLWHAAPLQTQPFSNHS